MGSFDIEICSNCGRDIARSEQAYIFEGKIVCAECDDTLRSGLVAEPIDTPEPPAAPEPITTVEPQFEELEQFKPDEQEKEKEYRQEDEHPGFIIAGVALFLIGVALMHIGLAGLAAFFIGGVLIGIVLAGWLFILGMLILISGIAAIIIAVISRQR